MYLNPEALGSIPKYHNQEINNDLETNENTHQYLGNVSKAFLRGKLIPENGYIKRK